MLEWVKIMLLIAGTTQISVVDGDTVRTNDGMPNVRLTGYNAPEIFSPKCVNEKMLGEAAKARLGALIMQHRSEAKLTITGGSCAFGRRCGVLSVAGQNVGDILISEKLAEPMACPGGRCPPAKDWCQP
jgi:micrococcal nuclease